MASPGHSAAIYTGGASTAFTGEAFTDLGDDVWQITSTARRVWDPDTVPDFFDDGDPIDPSDIAAIDYLFGKVTFSQTFVGPITADGAYIPLLAVASGYEYSVSLTADELDCTEFGDTAYRRSIGLSQCSGSISLWDVLSTDQDPGGGTVTLQSIFTGQTLALVSIRLTSSTDYNFRCWAYLNTAETSASVADLVGSTVEFVNVNRFDADDRAVTFNIGA